MKEKVKYNFDGSNGILYKNYFGEIMLDDIITSWEYAIKNNVIPKDIKGVVLDYRGAIIKVEFQENQLIADFYKKNIQVFKEFKLAVISEESIAVVISTLLQSFNGGYLIKPFSTVEYAIDWIMSGKNKD